MSKATRVAALNKSIANAPVWAPKVVNRTVIGGAPTGSWVPTATLKSEANTASDATSVAPEASAASSGSKVAAASVATPAAIPTSGFAGSGAAGAGMGLQSFYGTEAFALAPSLTATVNLANGNLNLHSADLAYNAPGLSVHLDSFNNYLASGNGALGNAMVLSTGQDVGLSVSGTRAGSTATFYGPSGFTAVFTAVGSGSSQTWTAPAGINADLVHNSDGTWALTYHATGEKLSFTSGGYLVKDVDRNGVGLSLSYNSANRLTSITDADGRVSALTYNSSGFVTKIADPFGRAVTYTYSTSGSLTKITYADGSTVNMPSPTGAMDWVQDPNGNWTHFSYDSSYRVIQVDRYLTPGSQSGAAATTKFAYTSSTTTTETNPLGGTSTYTLDSLGRVTTVVDPLGHSRATTWTPNSDVASATDAMGTGTGTGATAGNTTTYSYDSINNQTAVALPTGAAASAVYATGATCTGTTGTAYEAKCSTDAAGNTRGYSYDAAGNLLSVKDTTPTASGGTGATTQTYTYQSSGTSGTQCGGHVGQICTSTNGDGKVTSYAYDSNGNLTKVTPPSPLGATTYAYDTAGRVTSVTDGKGQTTSYVYDSRDRITKTTTNSGATLTASYDANGNLLEADDSVNGSSYWDYDTLGRETYRYAPNMGSTGIDTSYDTAGDVVATDDIDGNVTYAYNTAAQLTSLVEPTGPNGSNTTTTFTYDANGRELTRTLPNGVVQTTSYDKAGRTTEIKAVAGSGSSASTLEDFVYSYTAPGSSGAAGDRTLIQSRTDNVGIGEPAGSTISYTYDGLSRLKSATEKTITGATNASWAYTYDGAGNRAAQTTVGATTPGASASTPSATTTWGYNAANEITSRNGSSTGWSSDADGNQTSGTWGTGTYDDRGAVTALTPTGSSTPTSMANYGIGNSDRQSVGTTATVNGPLGLTATVPTTDENNTNNSGVGFRYTPDGALFSAALPDGSTRYYLTDIQGSVVAVTSGNSTTATYSYDPYGATRAYSGGEAGDNPFRYTGAYTDSTSAGLYHDGARYYDPTTARFTQADPAGYETNPWAYAGNNPTNYEDPAGTSACSVGESIAAFGGSLLAFGGAAKEIEKKGGASEESEGEESSGLSASSYLYIAGYGAVGTGGLVTGIGKAVGGC